MITNTANMKELNKIADNEIYSMIAHVENKAEDFEKLLKNLNFSKVEIIDVDCMLFSNNNLNIALFARVMKSNRNVLEEVNRLKICNCDKKYDISEYISTVQ